MAIITLTTDFGLKDPYLGAMKGAMLSINPKATIADISHLITPGNILEGAFVLAGAYSYFPDGAVHVGVADPGVGGGRRPILIETERYLFVGPDNGLLSLAVEREKVRRVVRLTEKKYFLKEVSSTFHGRDIFGPVAAHLTLGVSPGAFGDPLKEGPVSIGIPRPSVRNGVVKGTVIYVDSFGNLITNIKAGDLTAGLGPGYKDRLEAEIKGFAIQGLSKTYSAVAKGAAAAIIGSSNHMEIAVNQGKASEVLGAQAGEGVIVRLASP